MNNSNRNILTLPSLIGVSGRKRSGKDTVSDYLVENYGYQKLSFAGTLKDICKIIFNFTDEQLYGDDKEVMDNRWECTPRAALQFIGTELFRTHFDSLCPKVGANVWVKCLIEKLQAEFTKDPNARFVICDVRFCNEVQALRQFPDALILRMNRSGIPVDHHPSEEGIAELDVDIDITNNGALEQLHDKINALFYNVLDINHRTYNDDAIETDE